MPDFETQRQQLWGEIDALLSLRRLSAAREASQLLRGWLRNHPDDSYSREGGEEVAMMEEALEIIEAEKAAEAVAA